MSSHLRHLHYTLALRSSLPFATQIRVSMYVAGIPLLSPTTVCVPFVFFARRLRYFSHAPIDYQCSAVTCNTPVRSIFIGASPFFALVYTHLLRTDPPPFTTYYTAVLDEAPVSRLLPDHRKRAHPLVDSRRIEPRIPSAYIIIHTLYIGALYKQTPLGRDGGGGGALELAKPIYRRAQLRSIASYVARVRWSTLYMHQIVSTYQVWG